MMRKLQRLSLIIFLITAWSFQGAIAQHAIVDSLTAKFNAFRSKNFSEKIFLHTDRSSYLTAEDVWFTIYHVDASLHKSIEWSKVLYVELIGTDGKAVVQGKFPLGDSVTTGSLYLPTSLNTGNYELIAYTSWMKNFGTESFFRQTISIINPFVEFSKETDSGPEYDVQFFPEGGNLIAGLENIVGFRAVGRDGKGIMFKGAIVNQQNDTVVRFAPLKFGLGRFNFSPEQGAVYRVVLKDSKRKTFTYALPAIEHEGYSLQAVELNTKVKISVHTTRKETRSVFLLIHARQTNLHVAEISVNNGEGIIMLDKKSFSEGVSHITVFNSDLVPVCERLWFKKPERALNFVTKLDQPSYNTRDKVKLDISTENASSKLSNISVVVYKPDSLDLPIDNIVSYINLTSELKGNVEQADYYFGDESMERAEASNNLMLTHGWRKLDWQDVLNCKHSIKYFPELNGHIISGVINNKVSNTGVNQITSYLTFAGLPVNVYVSRTDSLGKFLFETQPGVGKKNLIIQANGRSTQSYRVTLDDPFILENSSYRKLTFSLLPGMKTALEQRSIHMQVNTLFNPKKSIGEHASTASPFYGKPDEQYLLDDYTRFPTMEEVMREYVPGVRVSKSRGQFELKNLDMLNKQPFRENPLVLVDGVPIFDMNVLMEIDPLKIKKLDVVTRKYYLQAGSYDGVVSLMSYKNDLGGFQPPADVLLTSYSCFEEQRQFFNPVYQAEKQVNSSVPDTRHVLYRSPNNLAASASNLNLSFYTSDISGTYHVIVQGITQDGVAGYSQRAFEVK